MTAAEERFVKVPASLVGGTLTDRAFRLYVAMGVYAWESTGSPCTASQATLGRDLHWSVDKVQTAAKELEKAGLLSKTAAPGKANTYTLTYRQPAVPTYRETTVGTYREMAVGDTAEQRQVPTAKRRYEAEAVETDERSSSTARSRSRGKEPTPRQLEVIEKIAAERGVSAQPVNSLTEASAEIERLQALPKSWEPATTEPSPYTYGGAYEFDVSNLEALERQLNLKPGSWHSYSRADQEALAARYNQQRSHSQVAA